MDVDDLLALPERKLNDWRLFDREEPIGPRESRIQRAIQCANFFNAHRPKGTPAKDSDDFLLQTVDDHQQRQLDKMLGMLSAVAKPRPPGYKRKRPRQKPQ